MLTTMLCCYFITFLFPNSGIFVLWFGKFSMGCQLSITFWVCNIVILTIRVNNGIPWPMLEVVTKFHFPGSVKWPLFTVYTNFQHFSAY